MDESSQHNTSQPDPTNPTDPVDTTQASIDRPHERVSVAGLINRHMHYPNAYIWLLLMSALDIMLTWIILYKQGREVNPIANYVIDKYGLDGMIVYKFALILFFIALCEIVGTLRSSTGVFLSRVSVAIAAFPVVWSLFLLARFSGMIG